MNRSATPTSGRRSVRFALRIGASGLLLGAIVVLSTCSPEQSLLKQVRSIGTLRVATVNSPTAYYIAPSGEPAGFEYDLAKGFADQLGVTLDLLVAASPPEAMQMALEGSAHLAAAGIAVNPAREADVRFSRPLQVVVPQLVYRGGRRKPKSLADLDGTLQVVAGSAYEQRLIELRDSEIPDLKWEASGDAEYEELLYRVSSGEIDYTIASSDLVSINRRYYPNLRVAFALADSQDLAWAFRSGQDTSLYDAAEHYFEAVGDDELSRLRDRYFGHIEQVGSYGALTLATHLETRLPKYQAAFESAGQDVGLDWRLLAAIGYQESHWDPRATSPTGVRGIMQLTNATAALLKIKNREDPEQSIAGGAAYFRMLLDKLPPEITEPDRTWLTLAAYNIGYGHLLDARDLTREQGADQNRWLDVRERLPLLTQRKWYAKTRYGYARGHEAVTYVGNVRTYYDMLVWMTGVPAAAPEPAAPAETPPPATLQPREKDPLDIDSPIL